MRVGGARPPPLITFTLTSKVAVYTPAEWADTLTLFHLYQYMYSVSKSQNPPEAGVLKKLSLAGMAKLSRLRYSLA